MDEFIEVFRAATGRDPYPYQRRLACGDGDCSSGAACANLLVSVPTGMGKTAAVGLSWLWNRIFHPDPAHRASWPTRLVYCLPMRSLVEQTAKVVEGWLQKLNKIAGQPNLDRERRELLELLVGGGSPVVLTGGESPRRREDWDVRPECPTILVGTQDMLLSRALNRGYGMSRYRWPVHFGLLNNDALWVFDETQIMGAGLGTTAQLEGLRHRFGSVAPAFSWWMSATLDDRQIATVDHPRPEGGWPTLRLGEDDRSVPGVQRRRSAAKKLAKASFTLASVKKGDLAAYASRLADLALQEHRRGDLTLVVLNRVARARAVFEAIRSRCPEGERCALVHSRYRPGDRKAQMDVLTGTGGRIVVATQAVEAGVDVSARTLITELAPWPSLVQRFGRCNRAGECKDARVFWINVGESDRDPELALPYDGSLLAQAGRTLDTLQDVGPASLEEVDVPPAALPETPVPRFWDLQELFDTTPDLCGNDLDVSPFIRDGADTDVQFFWRDVGDDEPPAQAPFPEPVELCRVPLAEAQSFLFPRSGPRPRSWKWSGLSEAWEQPGRLVPGGCYMVDVASGGYSPELGWTGKAADRPPAALTAGAAPPESDRDDLGSSAGFWQTLSDHLSATRGQAERIASSVGHLERFLAPLLEAAAWHDVGKAHACFQDAIRAAAGCPDASEMWAKSGGGFGRYARRGFRHELASALAWLACRGAKDAGERDLVPYLVAAHHGKVRLSLRPMPNEVVRPEQPPLARGVLHGDSIQLPEVPCDQGLPDSSVLDLSYMELGWSTATGDSWTERVQKLLELHGPFVLAFLEACLRAADARASATGSQQD